MNFKINKKKFVIKYDFQINVHKIIGVLLHNNTTTNQLHIDEFHNLLYV